MVAPVVAGLVVAGAASRGEGDPGYDCSGVSMNVTISIPPDLEEKVRRATGDLNTEVTRAFALELFRRGTLSHMELGRMLGLDRVETDAFLKHHGVFEGSVTSDDVDADRETLRRVLDKAG